MSNTRNQLIATDGELGVIAHFIKANDIVFDVGANIGDWTNQVFDLQPEVKVHLFEPVPTTIENLRNVLADEISSGKVIPNCSSIGQNPGSRLFFHYTDAPSWSTFHRRVDAEVESGLQEPNQMTVPVTTLDDYCLSNRIRRINFLKIDTEGGELDALKGAQQLLQHGRIDYIQFEYGGTYKDAGVTLNEVYSLLESYRYGIFKIIPGGLEYLPVFDPNHENYAYSNFLAVNERFLPTVLGYPPRMLNLREQCLKHRITPRGVLHIGAHEGSELKNYLDMGIKRVVFVEANPEIYQKLTANIKDIPGVVAVQCAISNHNGTVDLHVTSMDQSSSILPLKGHQQIYPGIHETALVTVPSRTIDTLLAELNLSPSDYNLLNIDIQGAELLALQGANDTLQHIDAINTEVNYEELYEGCVLIDELDSYLDRFGFERKATITPHHPSWGDGFYVKKPVIAMSTLGTNGRFGNQVFQYAFLRIFAREHGYRLETSDWIGQALFGHKDPPLTQQLPVVEEKSNVLSEAVIPTALQSFRCSDFKGFFQYHTSYYAPDRDFFRSLFRPVPALENSMNAAVERLHSLGKTVVGLHLRRADYGYDIFFVAPNSWYLDWLKNIWPTLQNPVLFIASDEPDTVVADFAEYNPVTASTLGISVPQAEFYPDFYLLSQCDVVAISNSSFSFAACMLNKHGKSFFRPDLRSKELIPFDPWNSEVLLRGATVESENQVESEATSDFPSILFLNTYYTGFIRDLYERRPSLGSAPYQEQIKVLQAQYFGDSNFYSQGLNKSGWNANDLVINCPQLQQAWAQENHISSDGYELVLEQIRRAKAQVVYFQDLNTANRPFVEEIRPHAELIAGQIASPVPDAAHLAGFDIIFSSFPHFVDRFRAAGLTSYYQPLAFEPRVLTFLANYEFQQRPVECSFVGGISPLHGKGYELLERLAQNTPIQFWGYGAGLLPPDSAIKSRHHGEVWGKEMFRMLGASRITVNRHIDVSEDYANNMRLFEATGCGALLITDYKDNLNDIFEIGTEVVAYRSAEECIDLINYYSQHLEEAEKIARAGQARTLRDHTYAIRMEQTNEILLRHLRYKRETDRLAMPSRISDSYQPLQHNEITPAMESAWKDPSIPLQQRALVQKQLEQMYRGEVAVPFQVLANILLPVISPGNTILEIGCASGYYYEVLEYLLKKRLAYTGVDYSQPMINMAKDYYPAATFFTADGASLFFGDQKFRTVISSCVLLHVPNWRQHVFETVRVAEKYVVVARTPICRNNPTRYMKKFAYGVETVELIFNEAELVREFLLNGLEIIDAIQYHTNPADDEYQVTYLFKRP